MSFSTQTTCRVCGAGGLTQVFDLGAQAVSDFVPRAGVKAGVVCPIVLDSCPRCGLVQQRHTVPPDSMFGKHYWYRCIGAQEKIFARIKNWGKYKDRDCLVHDTAERIFGSSHPVELPCVGLDGSVDWRPVLHRETSVRDVYEIEFFTGARVTASAEHRWPRVRSDMTWAGEKTTAELRPKTRVPVVMDMPRPDDAVDHESIYDEDAGYLVGVFIAEGCTGKRGVRLSVHRTNDEIMVGRLREYVTGRLYESFRPDAGHGNGMSISIIGPVVEGIIKKFVSGRLSKGKRLATAAWSQPTAFLKGVLDGWLDGDAHQEPESDRSRFNICKNTNLVEDMALACRIVGYTMRYRERKGSGFRGVGDTTQYCGWVRKSRAGMRQKNGLGRLMGTSVSRVWKKPRPKKVWDVAVGGSQLYALGCGIVTHNSGTTATMREALKDVVVSAMRVVPVEPGDLVLDIGSNDGTLLRCYPQGVITVGCEPAVNLLDEGRKGVDTVIEDFWSSKAFYDAVNRLDLVHESDTLPSAKVVTACGMFYDLENPNKFIADVADVLRDDGVFVAQLMCLHQTLKQADVGNLSHEHVEFYSLKSLRFLFERNGLELFDVQENAVNGGSYRVFARTQRASYKLPEECTRRVYAAMRAEGYLYENDGRAFAEFKDRTDWNRVLCVDFVRKARAAGKRVWVYGASTKGNVILQWYGLTAADIDACADKSPEKWGRFTVGTGIPITDEDAMRKANPDFLLVLPYAFRDEFVAREAEWASRGGRFIFPLPEFEVV